MKACRPTGSYVFSEECASRETTARFQAILAPWISFVWPDEHETSPLARKRRDYLSHRLFLWVVALLVGEGTSSRDRVASCCSTSLLKLRIERFGTRNRGFSQRSVRGSFQNTSEWTSSIGLELTTGAL